MKRLVKELDESRKPIDPSLTIPDTPGPSPEIGTSASTSSADPGTPTDQAAHDLTKSVQNTPYVSGLFTNAQNIIITGGTFINVVNTGEAQVQDPLLQEPNHSPGMQDFKALLYPHLVADTNGNHQPDIIKFNHRGVYISFNNGNNTFQDPKMVIQDFGYTAGWRVKKHIRFIADIRNTGRADILGFGNAGVLVSLNNGTGTFAPPKLVVADFGYNAGTWRIEKHLRFLGDVYGTGLLDIIGFGEYNVSVGRNNGDGTFEPGQAVVNDMCYGSGGWRIERHSRFVGDLTGDGRVDLIGFGDAGVCVALNNGNGTFQVPKLVLKSFGYNAGGWRTEKHPRFVSDLTGNGRADLIGFGNRGVSIALNNGDGTFQAPNLVLKRFGYSVLAGGWRVEKNPRFIADLTGNKAGDIVGFGNNGVYVAINNGDGTFQPARRVIDDFGYDVGGWRVEKHLRFPVDLTGDGCADIVGFGENAMYVSFNNGKGDFGPVQKLLT